MTKEASGFPGRLLEVFHGCGRFAAFDRFRRLAQDVRDALHALRFKSARLESILNQLKAEYGSWLQWKLSVRR